MRAAVTIGRSPPPEAALHLGFAAGSYRKDGVLGTFASLGGTLSGSPTLNASGLLPNNGQSAQIAYSITGDFMIVTDAVPRTTGTTDDYLFRILGADLSSDARVARAVSGTVLRSGVTNSGSVQTNADTATFTRTKIAIGRQGGNLLVCYDGGAVTSTAITGTVDLSGATVVVGNFTAGAGNGWKEYIRSFDLFLGQFNAADFQAYTA